MPLGFEVGLNSGGWAGGAGCAGLELRSLGVLGLSARCEGSVRALCGWRCAAVGAHLARIDGKKGAPVKRAASVMAATAVTDERAN